MSEESVKVESCKTDGHHLSYARVLTADPSLRARHAPVIQCPTEELHCTGPEADCVGNDTGCLCL